MSASQSVSALTSSLSSAALHDVSQSTGALSGAVTHQDLEKAKAEIIAAVNARIDAMGQSLLTGWCYTFVVVNAY